MLSHFKILPLLIVVAMLAFSVRLVEVATGISDLSGSAHAAKQEEPKVNAPESMTKKEPADDIVLAEASVEPPAKPSVTPENAGSVDDKSPSQDWVDAGDSDIDYSEVKMDIFNDLSERKQAVEDKERMLITREALLEAAEQELDRKYQEMLTIKAEIEELLNDQSEEERARIASLVKIYEGMKPKQAASIFNTLDIDVLTAVMSQMSERRLAPVLAAMNPERARSVTIILAEQKKLPELPQN